jgi:hypothetical protein
MSPARPHTPPAPRALASSPTPIPELILMRAFRFLPLLGAIALSGCGSDSPTEPPFSYVIETLTPTLSVAQDSTVALALTVRRTGGDSAVTLATPRISYQSSNLDVAFVDSLGQITGRAGGTANIIARAAASNDSLIVPVTVRARPVTSIEFRVLSGPAGGLLPSVVDTGTFYALPGEGNTARLAAVLKVGQDTVFCNYCAPRVAPSPPRLHRRVIFRSLDTARASVTNANNPATPDTSGKVIARDTTSSTDATQRVAFVLEIPGDGKSDTVYVRLLLRPIDSLIVRPDSATLPSPTSGALGWRVYPNADTTAANVVQNTVLNFAAGVTFRSVIQPLPVPPATALPARTQVNVFSTGTLRRAILPIVFWESANTDYLTIGQSGGVTAKCAFITATNCRKVTSGTGTTAVLTCNSTGPAMPQAFSGIGSYTVPGCVPTKTITPFPGALCTDITSASGVAPADLSATCSIWIRARATDPATNKALSRLYRINIRR